MSNLITKLARELVALINASPHSPTQAEIEDVLRKGGAEVRATVVSEDAGSFWRVGKVRFSTTKSAVPSDRIAAIPELWKTQATPNIKVGDKVTCTNGHVICEVLQDPMKMEPGTWAAAFGNWTQADQPIAGSMYKPKCAACGADFIHPDHWAFHFAKGWK